MKRVFTRGRIAGLVAKAKAEGRLPQLDGSVKCIDCGKPATVYDHRDYARPLDVEAVCQGCNGRRGKARHWIPDDVGGAPIKVRLTSEMVDRVDAARKVEDRDRSSMLRMLIRRGLDAGGRTDGHAQGGV